jgi:hypothetical protein
MKWNETKIGDVWFFGSGGCTPHDLYNYVLWNDLFRIVKSLDTNPNNEIEKGIEECKM